MNPAYRRKWRQSNDLNLCPQIPTLALVPITIEHGFCRTIKKKKPTSSSSTGVPLPFLIWLASVAVVGLPKKLHRIPTIFKLDKHLKITRSGELNTFGNWHPLYLILSSQQFDDPFPTGKHLFREFERSGSLHRSKSIPQHQTHISVSVIRFNHIFTMAACR